MCQTPERLVRLASKCSLTGHHYLHGGRWTCTLCDLCCYSIISLGTVVIHCEATHRDPMASLRVREHRTTASGVSSGEC